MGHKGTTQIAIMQVNIRNKGKNSNALESARQEYTDHLSRALNYAKKLGYPPQAVANDVLILSNSKI